MLIPITYLPMKKIKLTALAVLALFITLSSFTGGKKDLIGKWMPEKMKQGEREKVFDLNDGRERSIEFRANGKYYKDSSEEESGTWSLNKKGDKLTVTDGKFAGDWTVKKLTKKRCTISMTRDGREITLYMIPYKKPKKKKESIKKD